MHHVPETFASQGTRLDLCKSRNSSPRMSGTNDDSVAEIWLLYLFIHSQLLVSSIEPINSNWCMHGYLKAWGSVAIATMYQRDAGQAMSSARV